MQMCPTCGKVIDRRAVISRRDRSVRICQVCAYREGLLVAGIDQKEADRMVSRIQLAGGFAR